MKTATFIATLFFFALMACKTEVSTTDVELKGETMGTSYLVKYIGEENKEVKQAIDSLLLAINQSVSTYIPTSTISQVNQAEAGKIAVDDHFIRNFEVAKTVYAVTDGSFNPAVMPLVNYWGFGFEKLDESETIDSAEVKRLQLISNFNSFQLSENLIIKTNGGAQLDFSAIAKGYGVDQLALLLRNRGIENFLIEIGGETYAQGLKSDGSAWRVGIRKPTANEQTSVLQIVPLQGKALATSGNYENYRNLSSTQTVSHTINPNTGFPQSVTEGILSSSVIADDCMTADAYATAFKVMGLARSKQILTTLPELTVFFVYENSDGEIESFSTLEK